MSEETKRIKRRPKAAPGFTYKLPTGCGSLYVTITHDDEGNPFELFARLGKSGGCASATLEAISRVVSIGLRAGVPPQRYIKTLRSISCFQPTIDEGKKVASCVDACAQALEEALAGVRKKEEDKKGEEKDA